MRTVAVSTESAPVLRMFLFSAKTIGAMGSLTIDSPESDFLVLVDGKRLPYGRKGPPYFVYNVPAGVHQVQVQKQGYRTDPESVSADVKANRPTPLKFSLTVLPVTLIVQGALPGTRVSVASGPSGVTSPSAEFHLDLRPGTYSLTL